MRTSWLAVLIVKNILWKCFVRVLRIIQIIVWTLNGTRRAVINSRLPQNYHNSAQVLTVIARYKFDEYDSCISSEADFIATHLTFDSPQRVLQDHVGLYKVTDTEAIFVEALPGSELWRGRYSPFYVNALFRHAVRLVRLPLSSFFRLADQLDDPRNLTFIGTTSRCGSTLFTRMFEETGRVVAISQIYAVDDLLMKKRKGDARETDRMIVSAIRLLCKPTSLGELGFVIKLWSVIVPYLSTLKSLFPRAQFLFIYRDGLQVTKSLYRVSQAAPKPKLLYIKVCILATISKLLRNIGLSSMYSVRWKHIMAMCTAKWASNIVEYLRQRDAGLPIVAVRYEDLIADAETNMRRILRHCELPEQMAVDAVRALSEDSQSNTPGASSYLRRHAAPEYEGEVRSAIDEVCDFYGLPRFSEHAYIVPGTITTS